MSTQIYVQKLSELKAGSKSLLRLEAGQPLDHTLAGFDLFTGLWWPLRQKSQKAPRRRVAWLVAKLYAVCPLPHSDAATLPRQLGCIWKELGDRQKESFQQRFDALLSLPLAQLEPGLQWALREIASAKGQEGLNWQQLTDDLSRWEREDTRQQWAEVFLGQSQTQTPTREYHHE